ncbi:MAG: CheR family methyltransferase [Methylococcaceae bacterium]
MPTTQKTINEMNRILTQLRKITGHDFTHYKKSTIHRRIERRMVLHNISDIDVYARFLKENTAEVHALFKELLINVTSFFRDADAFSVLQKDILPKLFKDKRPDDHIFRVWVTGCSTGEESYSIAILLYELICETHHWEFKIQFYSTDLDDEAITIARAGLYSDAIAQDVSPERLRRFFSKEDSGYRINKEIREMVVFAVQNVIKDPPFTKLDLLSCRNLMIYLTPELQEQLIPAFHYALKAGGVLFLSPSESIGNHVELFSSIDRKWKFYRAEKSTTANRVPMNNSSDWTVTQKNYRAMPDEIITTFKETNFAELTRRLLVQFFAPASVITDLKGNIIYVHGDTGKYLRPAAGHASLNVIDMSREGLNLDIYAAIHSTVNTGISVINQEMFVKSNDDLTKVSLSVRLVPSSETNQSLLLISFQDVISPKLRRKRTAKSQEVGRTQELEHELAYLKESYQSSVEEQQASNEELKSTNEELQSTNEELQSTNEELETSKEELQSVNEELITVNSELQVKIEQLAGIQNDMKNLLDNVNIGIIFLDRYLTIRRFTRDAVKIYRLVPSDVGRPLNDIKSIGESEGLLTAAQAVLDSLIPYEQEMQISENVWMLARIQPYRTLDNVIDGVVLTFTDITARINANIVQHTSDRETEERLTLILGNAELAAWDWNIETNCVVFNEHWLKMHGFESTEIDPTITFWKNTICSTNALDVQLALTAYLKNQSPFFTAEYQIKTKSGESIWVMGRGAIIERNNEGKPIVMTCVEININERKQSEINALNSGVYRV